MNDVIKLLIVDDESRFLNAIATRLKKRGLDVTTATKGHAAIALAR
jgi:ActR/RegA family two-component response regulator